MTRTDGGAGRVSVIITAHDAVASLRRTLTSLRAQRDAGDWELLVVADRCRDATAGLGAEFPDLAPRIVRYADENRQGQTTRQASLALGAGLASGQILLFTDADARVPPDWIAGVRARLQICQVFCGPVFHHGGSWFWDGYLSLDAAFNLFLYRFLHRLGLPSGGFGPNLAVRRDCYLAAGGHQDQPFALGEDRVLVHTLEGQGARVCHCPGPAVRVDSVGTLRRIIRRGRRVLPGGCGPLAVLFTVGGLVWIGLLLGGLFLGGSWWLAFLGRAALGLAVIAGAALWVGAPSLLMWVPLYEPVAMLIAAAVLLSLRWDPVIDWGGRPYRH